MAVLYAGLLGNTRHTNYTPPPYVGHVAVLYAGLLGNVARFFYISLLSDPWWVLPFEFVQGQ